MNNAHTDRQKKDIHITTMPLALPNRAQAQKSNHMNTEHICG